LGIEAAAISILSNDRLNSLFSFAIGGVGV